MLKLLLPIAVTLSASWGAKLDIACRGVGTAIRDDRDLCSYWRCLEDNNVAQVSCPPGFRVPCSMTSTNGECVAAPCTERLGQDQCSAATCREYEPPEDTTTIDGDSVATYIELCLPTSGDVSEAVLLSRGSTRCDPPEEDKRDTAPKGGFMFNEDTGFCGRSSSRDYGKVFDSVEECQFTCEDPCQQLLNRGITGCGDQVEAYYYDENSRRCKSFQYLGCGGNKNRFDSSRDCWLVCVSDGPQAGSGRPTPRVPGPKPKVPRSRRAPAATRSRGRPEVAPRPPSSVNNQQAYCKRIDQASPLLRGYLQGLHDVSLGQTNTLGIGELADAVDDLVTTPEGADVAQIGSSRVKRQFNPGGLLNRRLFWATVVRRRSCRRFDVTVRIFCVSAIIRPPPRTERRRLCNLIASGIQQYWTRQLVISGQTWDFVVRVKQQFFLGKMVVLKYFEEDEGNTRSHNFDISPMTMKYPAYLNNADQEFSETAAHELTHSVLMNSKGLVWSWGHKGTSTIFGGETASTPTYPTGDSEIDLMLYYSNIRPGDYFNRVKLTQGDAIALIQEATFFFPIPWCPGELGAPCLFDSQCNSGHCHGLRCVECEADSQCNSFEYCHGINNLLIVNRCRTRRPNGQFCVRDRMCISSNCDGARCVECEQDNQCSAAEFCYGKNNALILNRCDGRRSRGSLCTRNAMCLSNRCAGGRCVDCESDSHCSSSRYCHGINVPLDINECRSRRGIGSLCVRDRMCALGHCDGGRCGECSGDGDCPSHEYCKNRDKPLVTNVCRGKRCTGWCNRKRMCKSNHCKWTLRCRAC